MLKDSAVYQRGNCVEAGPMVSLLLPYLARSRVVVGLVVPGSGLIHLPWSCKAIAERWCGTEDGVGGLPG